SSAIIAAWPATSTVSISQRSSSGRILSGDNRRTGTYSLPVDVWWHQFEQPFENTAALNLWSRDRDNAPEAADKLEEAVLHQSGINTGFVLDALANGENSLATSEGCLLHKAKAWQTDMSQLQGDHAKCFSLPKHCRTNI
ncbi:hypothetical protein ACHAWF_003274, partial [Thalassiosira exigua]